LGKKNQDKCLISDASRTQKIRKIILIHSSFTRLLSFTLGKILFTLGEPFTRLRITGVVEQYGGVNGFFWIIYFSRKKFW